MATMQKPVPDLITEALKFATEGQAAPEAAPAAPAIKVKKQGRKAADVSTTRIFFAPKGDKRLTININEKLHKRLKIAAINQGKTAGEIIEELLEANI